MENKEVVALLHKYITETCTEQEKATLESWYLNSNSAPINELSPEQFALDLLIIREGLPLTKPVPIRPLWPRIAVAAAMIAIICSIGLLFYTSSDDRVNIKSGKSIATLTLSNGKTIALRSDKEGVVIDVNKLVYNDGTALNVADAALNNDNGTLSISTPKGGTYEVILVDGTHVWLNASSTLAFPAKFKGVNRNVSLDGEGYFEVAKNKGFPFKVTSGLQEVKVLGTHFNINAYANESAIRTTLLEGSVRVSLGSNEKLLMPGEQTAVINNEIFTTKVDVNSAVAWKNNRFVFEHENIRSIMRKIERWYKVEVVFKGNITNDTFTGGVSRYENLAEALKPLESTGNVTFEVIDRTIYVTMP